MGPGWRQMITSFAGKENPGPASVKQFALRNVNTGTSFLRNALTRKARNDRPNSHLCFRSGHCPGVLEGKPMNYYEHEDPLSAARGIVTGFLLTFDAFILGLIVWLIVR